MYASSNCAASSFSLTDIINSACDADLGYQLTSEVSCYQSKPTVKILLVDDSPFMHELIEWQLSELMVEHSIQVLKAFNGRMGLRMMLSEQPQIVVTDVNMPVQNSPEMLDDLRHSKEYLEEGYNPHLIALTSQFDPTVISQLIALGVNHYYTKPFNSQALLNTLRFLLTQSANYSLN